MTELQMLLTQFFKYLIYFSLHSCMIACLHLLLLNISPENIVILLNAWQESKIVSLILLSYSYLSYGQIPPSVLLIEKHPSS